MKSLAEIRSVLEDQKPYLAKQYGVIEVGVFGSYVRGEQKAASDIDVLIRLERPPKISLIDLIELEDYLSQLLDTRVDIAIKSNLKRRIGNRILHEMVPI